MKEVAITEEEIREARRKRQKRDARKPRGSFDALRSKVWNKFNRAPASAKTAGGGDEHENG